MEKKVLSINETAEYLGVERTTLWRMYSQYKIIAKPMQISYGRTGYSRAYLESWLNQRMVESEQNFA